MAEKNQTQDEQTAVAVGGRKGLERAVEAMRSDIMAVAAADIAKHGDQYLQRAIIAISGNDSLKGCLATKPGQLSVIKSIQKAATMGLQIGGQFPHCHLVGYSDKAELIVSAQGYKHAAIHGNGATLEDIEVSRVYEGDKVRIYKSEAKVSHEIDPVAERGKLVGVYAIITKRNGKKIVEYMSKADALRIRDAHSTAYKSGRSSPWKTDEEAMVEKTAIKFFLRPYAAESEGLAMLYSSEDETQPQDWAPPPRDVTDRIGAHLEARAERITAGPAKEPEAVPAEAEVIDQPAAETGAKAELF